MIPVMVVGQVGIDREHLRLNSAGDALERFPVSQSYFFEGLHYERIVED